MDAFVSHISAAIFWEIPYLDFIVGNTERVDPEVAAPPLHLTYRKNRKWPRDDSTIVHLWAAPLPRGAVVEHKGTRVASLELVFLQLAPTLGFHRTLLLGLSLCAHEPGRPEQAITSAAKIRKFMEKAKGLNGGQIAARAADYLADGSNSIMESLLYMFLVLPPQFGGFGLSGAVFNYEIRVAGRGTSLRNRRVFVDLYWKEAKLALEYDSDKRHWKDEQRRDDMRRLMAIRSLGVEALSVSTTHLYNEKALHDMARAVARHLGKRIRIRNASYEAAYKQLRALLPVAVEG